jgi:hypothetical protein
MRRPAAFSPATQASVCSSERIFALTTLYYVNWILTFILAASAAAFAQTAKLPEKAPAKSAVKAVQSKAAASGANAADDKRIEAAIRAKLATSKIGKDGFTIRVQGGAAYWDGTTSVLQHKGAATRMAKAAGAARVVNNIKVSDAAKAKATENLEQGPRRAQIKRGDPRSQQ